MYVCGPCSECIPILPVLYVCLYVAVPADGECRRSSGHGGLRCGDKGQRVPAWGDGTRLHRSSLRDTGHGSHCLKGALYLCTYILWLQYVSTYMHICVCACHVHVCMRLSISKTARVWHATLVHIAVCVHICMYVCMPPPHVLQ